MNQCVPEQAMQFLSALFKHYKQGYIEIRSISREDKPIRRDWIEIPYGLKPENLRKTAMHCCNLAMQRYDVYVGVCPRFEPAGPGRKSGKDAVHQVGVVWVDLDKKVNGASLDLLEEADIIVDSGNGWHGYRLLEKVRDVIYPRDKKDIEVLVRRYADTLLPGTDSVANVDRILRVPGTLNHKGEPKPVTLVKCPGIRFTQRKSRWEPWFQDERLDALLASAEQGLLGIAKPRIKCPEGRIIDDLDCAVVGLYQCLKVAEKKESWAFAIDMAKEDLPKILEHLYGDVNGRLV